MGIIFDVIFLDIVARLCLQTLAGTFILFLETWGGGITGINQDKTFSRVGVQVGRWMCSFLLQVVFTKF